MFILAAFLSFGWPVEKTQWLPQGSAVPSGTKVLRINPCCGSMRPALKGGETAYAIRPDGRRLAGYIVTTKRFTHRVVAETKDAVMTAGDANRHSDGYSPKSEVEWIILYVERP